MNIYIIGASKGIGAGIAEAFAQHGNNLFIASRDLEGLKSLQEKFTEKYNITCNYNYIDVKNVESIKSSFDECYKTMGTPDIVIYNAGISKTDNFNDFKAQNLKDIFYVNVFGLIDSMEIILPTLLKSNKNVIFAATSSLAEFRGVPGNAGYTSSKISASHILEAARCQLFETNVKICTIKPGFVHTNLTSNSKYKMPLVIYPDKAGRIIAKKLLRGKTIVAFPRTIQFFSWAAKSIPTRFYDFVMKKVWKNKNMLENY